MIVNLRLKWDISKKGWWVGGEKKKGRQGKTKDDAEQKDGKAEGMFLGLSDKTVSSIDQNVYLPPQCVQQRGAQDVRLVLKKYGLDEDLLGLNGNADVFQLGFSIVEVGLDVTRHVSRPITCLEVLAEKNQMMFVYNFQKFWWMAYISKK